MSLFVVVIPTYQHRVNLRLSTFEGSFLLSERTYDQKKFQYTERREEVWGCLILLTDFLQIRQKLLGNRQVKFVTRRESKII